MDIEKRMILRTFESTDHPLTALEVTRHWNPSWNLNEVNVLLGNLVNEGRLNMINTFPRQFQIRKCNNEH